MIRSQRWAIACGLALLIPAAQGGRKARGAHSATQIATLLEGQLAVSFEGGSFKLLTHDSSNKSLPLWSSDGSRIAFISKSAIGPGDLVVIDREGTLLLRAPIHSAQDNV